MFFIDDFGNIKIVLQNYRKLLFELWMLVDHLVEKKRMD